MADKFIFEEEALHRAAFVIPLDLVRERYVKPAVQRWWREHDAAIARMFDLADGFASNGIAKHRDDA